MTNHIFIIILCFILIISVGTAKSAQVYPQDTYAFFEYDDNVTREALPEDYQYGIVWRLYTGFGIKDIIPIKGLDTKVEYELGMRDVNTTNDEDYNSHRATFSTGVDFKTGTSISLEEIFKVWNSQSDLFHFYDNSFSTSLDQSLGEKTIVSLSYKTEQKWLQNDDPEVQARNFYYHQLGVDIDHKIAEVFGISLGYVRQFSVYNRSPIDFKGGMPIVLDGVQRDRQNVLSLGFEIFPLNNTSVSLINQIVNYSSNSRAFNFNGNRIKISILSMPFRKLSLEFAYRIVAYELGAYQTSAMGYELSEIRTDDQSGINLGLNYKISDQTSLQMGYEHIENSVFFTKEFYKENIYHTGLKIRF